MSKTGFLETFQFSQVERISLMGGFKDIRAEKFVAEAESAVARHRLVAVLDIDEPSRGELRKELCDLAKFFAQIHARCSTLSASAAALIRTQGGANGVQFLELAQYFLDQSGAAARGAGNLKNGKGRGQDSNRYIDILVTLVRAHWQIFGSELKASRGTAAHALAQKTLEAAGFFYSPKHVETGLLKAKGLLQSNLPSISH